VVVGGIVVGGEEVPLLLPVPDVPLLPVPEVPPPLRPDVPLLPVPESVSLVRPLSIVPVVAAPSLVRPVLPAVPELPWLVDAGSLYVFALRLFFFAVLLAGDLASFRVLSGDVLLEFCWPAACAPVARAMAMEAPIIPLSKGLIRMLFLLE
jgi:hypothetical protein